MSTCSIFSPIVRKAKLLEAAKAINYKADFACDNAKKSFFPITNGENWIWINTSKVAGVEYVVLATRFGLNKDRVLDEIAAILGVQVLSEYHDDYWDVSRRQGYRLNAKHRAHKAQKANKKQEAA